MTSLPKPKLSSSEKLSFLKTILSIPIKTPLIVGEQWFKPHSDSLGARQAAAINMLKTITSIPVNQQVSFFPEPPTGKSITKFCSKSKPPHNHEIVPLAQNGYLHLVSPAAYPIKSLAKPRILLFFHGGGYLHMAGPTHIPFAYECSQAMAPDTVFAVLEYTISPVAPFPTQLQQAISALNHVLTLTPASHITLLGDSAGAHLAITLVSHAMHPDIKLGLDNVTLCGEKLGGLCLVSPMLSNDVTKPSYKANGDYLSDDAVQGMFTMLYPPTYTYGTLYNPLISPAEAPIGHWINIPASRVLVTIGGNEAFLDSCLEFVQRLKDDLDDNADIVELAVGEGEWHDAPVVDCLFGVRRNNEGTVDAIMSWMRHAEG